MLADKLDEIAQGETFSCDALASAKIHPVTTNNDALMLNRYLFGANCSDDRFRLQELAIYIREYDNATL